MPFSTLGVTKPLLNGFMLPIRLIELENQWNPVSIYTANRLVDPKIVHTCDKNKAVKVIKATLFGGDVLHIVQVIQVFIKSIQL